MKNKLQYMYTITVLVGVLATAYLMMSKEGNGRIPLRAFETPLRTDAQILDPGIKQLFEMETALKGGQIPPEMKPRLPTNAKLND